MRIRIYGKNKLPADEIRDFVHWLAKRLFKDKRTPLISVIHKKISDEDGHIICGYMTAVKSDNGTSFRLYLNESLPARCHRTVISHEMIHSKQYLLGESDGKTFWKKRRKKTFWSEEEDGYNNLPWEIEAYRRQRNLVRAYRRERLSNG